MTRDSSRPPHTWPAAAAELLAARPELAGCGCVDVAALGVSAA